MPNFSTIVASRYAFTGRRDLFFSSIALLSVLGVAIGVAAMIVVLSVINGFERELRQLFLNANAHVLMFRYPDGLSKPHELQLKLSKDFAKDITGSSPFVHYETMIKHGGMMHSVLVRGFNPREREKVQSVKQWIKPISALDILTNESEMPIAKDLPSVIIGEGLLKLFGLNVGDSIEIISPVKQSTGQTRSFRIVGTYRSGLKHYDNRLVAMALPTAQSFFGMGVRVTGLEVGLIKPNDSVPIAAAMRAKYSMSIKEWQSFNRQLLEALNMERTVIFLMVCIVAIVAGLNILTTLFIAVAQKQRFISLLRALGATKRQIIGIFLKQGILFGLIGASMGTILALLISALIEKYQFIELPDPYYLSHLPVSYDWRVYLILSIFGIVVCIIAGILPSIIASAVTPTDGLKHGGRVLD